jgi:hypothetical protein
MFKRELRINVILLLGLSLLLSSCYFSVPNLDSLYSLNEMFTKIHVNSSTKEEVFGLLGYQTDIKENNTVWIYEETVDTGWIFIPGKEEVLHRTKWLYLRFNDNGILVEKKFI